MKRIAAVAAALALLLALGACQKEGPAERAGKEVDRTVDMALFALFVGLAIARRTDPLRRLAGGVAPQAV